MNNLNNLSDEELDKLFRQSAEERDVEFDEGAWQKMNALLDEKQPFSTNWRKYLLIILAVLFLGSTAVYFGNKNGIFNSFQNGKNSIAQNGKNVENKTINNDDSKVVDNEIKENTNTKTEKPLEIINKKESKIADNESINKAGNSNLENINSENKSKKLEISNLKNNRINNINNSQNTKNKSSEDKFVTKIEKVYDTNKSNLKISENTKTSISAKNIQPKNSLKQFKNTNESSVESEFDKIGIENKNSISSKIDNSESINISVAGNSKTRNSKIKNNKRNSILDNKTNFVNTNLVKSKIDKKGIDTDSQEITNTNVIRETSIEKTYLQTISLDYLLSKTGYNYKKPSFAVNVVPLELDLPEPKKIEYFKKGLAIRLAVSPDISTISGNKISKIGSNIGGLLEYRFSDKLSIQAGVFRSMKYYNAMPDQYNWVWGYSNDKLKNINAQCEMMDYPVNIRYDFLTKGTTRIFIGVGATTYKMMNEKYNYNYVNNYSPTIMHREWNGNTGTYYTSNLNLSIGLEKYISKYFTMQVEPFAKSPLKNVGFGKVPLITYGMMISGKMPLNSIIKK